jgi:CDGSH-type Zn-finger protein
MMQSSQIQIESREQLLAWLGEAAEIEPFCDGSHAGAGFIAD